MNGDHRWCNHKSTLVAKEGKDFKSMVNQILGVVDGPISVEVISTESEGMVKEALVMSKWSKNIVIKIPIDP